MSDLYLLPEDDGLPMRESNDYAKDKLHILQGYIYRFITSMKGKPWKALFFIDLLAGSGKNFFDSHNDVMLGSPLISLNAPYPFTHYRFVEADLELCEALRKRVSASERKEKVRVLHGDCNQVVDEIVKEVQGIDRLPAEKGKWSTTLNLAILDPEGLELHWETVKKLGQVSKMDLIVNFSTMGFTRNANNMIAEEESRIDLFFGTTAWKEIYLQVADKDITHVRRAMLDYYKKRLTSLGYTIHPEEKAFRNSRNAQVYTLMFASKHDLGNKFWSGAIQEVSQPKLF